jgi:hypothetical protein
VLPSSFLSDEIGGIWGPLNSHILYRQQSAVGFSGSRVFCPVACAAVGSMPADVDDDSDVTEDRLHIAVKRHQGLGRVVKKLLTIVLAEQSVTTSLPYVEVVWERKAGQSQYGSTRT